MDRIVIRVSSSYVDFQTQISRYEARQKYDSRHSQPLSAKLQPNTLHTSPDRQAFQTICAATEDPIKLFIQDPIKLRTQVSIKTLSSRSSPVRFKTFSSQKDSQAPSLQRVIQPTNTTFNSFLQQDINTSDTTTSVPAIREVHITIAYRRTEAPKLLGSFFGDLWVT